MPTIRVKENEPFEVALRAQAQEGCRHQASLQASAQHDAAEEAVLILF